MKKLIIIFCLLAACSNKTKYNLDPVKQRYIDSIVNLPDLEQRVQAIRNKYNTLLIEIDKERERKSYKIKRKKIIIPDKEQTKHKTVNNNLQYDQQTINRIQQETTNKFKNDLIIE